MVVMACDVCLGLLIISITSFIIGGYLLNKYLKNKNTFTAYMVIFFFANGIGFLIRFLTTDWVFNIYQESLEVLVIIGILPQIILLLFVLAFFEVDIKLSIVIVIVVIGLTIVHLFVPQLHILTYVATVIIIANVVLFILNWRRNQDIKSLGFSIGLLCILIGEALYVVSPLVNGIFLILTSIAWLITYSGLLEKITA